VHEHDDGVDRVAAADYLKLVKPLLSLEVPHLSKPNDSQKRAVEHAMQQPFSLIQGPPGTGKTVTAVRLAYQFVKLNERLPREADNVKPQVMICGPSNKSVDVIAGRYFQHHCNDSVAHMQYVLCLYVMLIYVISQKLIMTELERTKID